MSIALAILINNIIELKTFTSLNTVTVSLFSFLHIFVEFIGESFRMYYQSRFVLATTKNGHNRIQLVLSRP